MQFLKLAPYCTEVISLVRQLWFIDGFTLEVANLSEGNGVGSKASLENSPKQILCKVSYKSNSMEKVLDWLNKEC